MLIIINISKLNCMYADYLAVNAVIKLHADYLAVNAIINNEGSNIK